MKPALQSVGVDQSEFFVKTNSPTPFLREFLLAVLRTHLLFTEVAQVVVEIHAIQR